MATTDKYRLSLVAQYDEIVRNRAVLTAGIEAEFIAFVASQEELRKRYVASENELANLREKVKSLENENMALETKLKHARNQIDVEIGKRKRTEEEREGYEKQILLVQEILRDKNNTTILNDQDREKLAFLSMTCKSPMYDHSTRSRNMPMIEESCSILSPSDISYDKTEEDLDESIHHHHQQQHKGNRRGGKRPSAPPFEEEEEDVDGVIIGGNFQQSRPTSIVNNVEQAAKKHRRSKSADLVTMEMMNNNIMTTANNNGMSGVGAGVGALMDGGKTPKTPRDRRNSSPFGILNRCNSQDSNIPLAGKSPELKRFNSGNSLTRPHYFQNIHHYKQESCFACNKKLKFGAAGVKCKDCKILCHDACKDLAPLPCMATINTPKVNKSSPGFLSDYAPSEPPFVPAIVIHCIKEVELRGLKEVGVYRVSGSDKEVKELKEKFLRGKTAPNLSSISDIHVICSCLKDFLRNLKEPLVTYQLWSAFLRAAEKHDRQESITDTYQVISMLPISNRDTFAYIILHLLRVSECKECRMDINNLVKVFAPTMIGFSCPNPTPTQMIQETARQQMVMNRLIDIPSDYWFNFLRVQDGGVSFQFSTPSNDRLSQRLDTLTHTTARGVLTSSSSNANIINTPGNYYEASNNNNNYNNYNGNNNNNNGWFTPSNQMRATTTTSNYSKKTTNFFAPPILK